MRFKNSGDGRNDLSPINWLMYKSYEFQRDNSPHIEAERWRKLYLYQEEYEKIYQALRRKNEVIC